MIRELLMRNRSYRRFDENVAISAEQLISWIGLARYTASGRNAQPLKYIPIRTREDRERLFPSLGWAGYLTDWDGPAPGERPSAYVIIVNDTEIATNYFCDDGINAQTILLGAVEDGFGGCMIASLKKEAIRQAFSIPERYQILMVLALGKPIESVVLEDMKDGNYKYWRDASDVHHVPKRSLEELIIRL